MAIYFNGRKVKLKFNGVTCNLISTFSRVGIKSISSEVETNESISESFDLREVNCIKEEADG